MAKIFVAGSIPQAGDDDPSLTDARAMFVRLLGREIIAQGHVLLGGCRNSLDSIVTEAALEEAQARQLEPRRVIRSWVSKAKAPAHSNGEIVRSRMADWGQIPRGYIFPEPVQEADVVIVVGGTDPLI